MIETGGKIERTLDAAMVEEEQASHGGDISENAYRSLLAVQPLLSDSELHDMVKSELLAVKFSRSCEFE